MSTNERDEAGQCGTAEIPPPHIIALIRERQRRIAALPRYDRYIAQAAGYLTVQGFWRYLRQRDEDDIQRMKNWLNREAPSGSESTNGHSGGSDPSPRPQEARCVTTSRYELGRDTPHPGVLRPPPP